MSTNDIQPLEEYDDQIRTVWDEESQTWYFAIVDVVGVLSEAANPSKYWHQLKTRDKGLKELSPNWRKFPMKSKVNKRTYQTECASQQDILRIIQSIPSPKAEFFKQWLAMTGSRRLDEIKADPLEAEREKYRLMGYDEEWIRARLGAITTRNELTDEWKKRGVEGRQYGILTNEVHKGTFDGLSVGQHKTLKGVKKGNLRDHMNPLELAFTILGEAITTDEVRHRDAQGYEENQAAAKEGGEAAGEARRNLEKRTGRKVISDRSYLEDRKLIQDQKKRRKDSGSSKPDEDEIPF